MNDLWRALRGLPPEEANVDPTGKYASMIEAFKGDPERQALIQSKLDAARGRAEDASALRRERQLSGMKGIAEGLGRIGSSAVTGAQIRAGVDLPPPLRAESIREELMKAQDYMPSADRRVAGEALGVHLKPTTFKRFDVMTGPLGQAVRLRHASAEAALDRASREKIAEANREAYGERMGAAIESREKIAAMPRRMTPRLIPGQQTEMIANEETLISMIDDADSLYTAAANKIGPVQSRVRSAWQKIAGEGDPDFRKLESQIDQIVSLHVLNRSGRAATDQERKDLAGQLMSKIDSPELFKAALDQFRKNAVMARENHIKGFERSGYDTSRYQNQGTQNLLAPEGGGGTSGKIDVRIDGQEGRMTQEQLDRFRVDNPNAVIEIVK